MIEKFKEIFEGNQNAYGQLILSGATTEKGKAIGKPTKYVSLGLY